MTEELQIEKQKKAIACFEQVKEKFESEIDIHGSIPNGTQDLNSDVDIIVYIDLMSVLDTLNKWNTKLGRVQYQVNAHIKNARVPVLKVSDLENKIEVDFVQQKDDVHWKEKDTLIQLQVKFDPRVLQVIRILKRWRHQNLEYLHPKLGFPNNYAFQVILIYVMIRLNVVPRLKQSGIEFQRDEQFRVTMDRRRSAQEIWVECLHFLSNEDSQEIIDLRKVGKYDYTQRWLIREPVTNETMTCNSSDQPTFISIRALKELAAIDKTNSATDKASGESKGNVEAQTSFFNGGQKSQQNKNQTGQDNGQSNNHYYSNQNNNHHYQNGDNFRYQNDYHNQKDNYYQNRTYSHSRKRYD